MDCNADLKFFKEIDELVCDSCMEDKEEVDGYICSAGCEFALCVECAECKNRHLLSKAIGKPHDQNVSCDRCGKGV